MRRFLLLALFFTAVPAFAQTDIAGAWHGDLDQSLVQPGAPVVPIIVRFVQDGDGYTATYDTPTQSAYSVPVDTVEVEGMQVRAVLVPIGGAFVGTIGEDGQSITGTWTQGRAELPLVLTPMAEVADESGPKSNVKAGDLSGKWTGVIARSTGGESRIHLVLTRTEAGGYNAGYLPPGQTTPIDLGPVVLAGSTMTIQIGGEASFTGTVAADESSVEGQFSQGADKRPMTLTRD